MARGRGGCRCVQVCSAVRAPGRERHETRYDGYVDEARATVGSTAPDPGPAGEVTGPVLHQEHSLPALSRRPRGNLRGRADERFVGAAPGRHECAKETAPRGSAGTTELLIRGALPPRAWPHP